MSRRWADLGGAATDRRDGLGPVTEFPCRRRPSANSARDSSVTVGRTPHLSTFVSNCGGGRGLEQWFLPGLSAVLACRPFLHRPSPLPLVSPPTHCLRLEGVTVSGLTLESTSLGSILVPQPEAHSSGEPGRRPLKAEITGPNPVCASTFRRTAGPSRPRFLLSVAICLTRARPGT